MNLWLQIHGKGTDPSAQVVVFDSISYNSFMLGGLNNTFN